MRHIVLGLAVMFLCAPVVSAEFVVKYFIDGHIFAGEGPCATSAEWCADLDGDGMPEMLVLGDIYSNGTWNKIGITRSATWDTQWFSPDDVGTKPCAAWLDGGGAILVRPILRDVDGDALLDVLVPVLHDGQNQMVVIGWSGAGATGDRWAVNPSARLSPAVPSPSRGAVSLEFEIASPAQVRLAVYDVSGRMIRLVVDEDLGAGSYMVPWDGRDELGGVVPSGAYFYRLTADGVEERRQAVLLR